MTDQPHAMLKFDYDAVDGQRVVTGAVGDASCPGVWQSIAILFGSDALILRVDRDTDQIGVSLESASMTDGWSPVEALAETVGSTIGWCWSCENYRGYFDMFVVSFSGIEPQFGFLAAASALSCLKLIPLS